MEATWQDSMRDPALDEQIDLDHILSLYPRLQGEPAFDPELAQRKVSDLVTEPVIDTGHPLLDAAVKVGLAHIDLTFQGNHPKYGTGHYFKAIHDGFPPTIIAAVDALSAWGLIDRAGELWEYWLRAFVAEDGRIHYYGTSLSEYGQLLHTGALLRERGGTTPISLLQPLAEYVIQIVGSRPPGDLVVGAPEADEAHRLRRYFHNNAWLAKGLRRWGGAQEIADALARDTLAAIRDVWPKDSEDWWLAPEADSIPNDERPKNRITDTNLGSFTNYRYWPELLSSDLLPTDLANRVVDARQNGGGQFCGMTRFMEWLDDWPLVDYLQGLWSLGRKEDFKLSLFGHVAYHQAEGHLTAYEQITFPPGRERAAYCLPCQLVPLRMARYLEIER